LGRFFRCKETDRGRENGKRSGVKDEGCGRARADGVLECGGKRSATPKFHFVLLQKENDILPDGIRPHVIKAQLNDAGEGGTGLKSKRVKSQILRSSWLKVDLSFPCEPGCVGQTGSDVIGLKVWIIGQNLLFGCAGCEQAQDGGHRNPHAANAGQTRHDVRIHRYAL
jgi:hypothetical protein